MLLLKSFSEIFAYYSLKDFLFLVQNNFWRIVSFVGFYEPTWFVVKSVLNKMEASDYIHKG
jgi:hypothetical protein